ncbi:MAG: tRNA (N(6)-L-threonylcarbamoyladenosine(37)-C(2))-methylthiotransferase MtaB [Clostridiales bacterium]|jgi:threonylcarbamoyladenosine tRNA methylthiotransferase MtaB|nr:tRNA (N(6)-L-threonylcarbamoyladenosine(37)-C(2))-methylthiotransferase MtaB [Clostridiales bacterium]
MDGTTLTVCAYTLGCKVNVYDTEKMMEQFKLAGFAKVPETERGADVYVVNTCSVTAMADKKSRQAIRRAKRENPQAVIVVCGCFAQLSPQQALDIGADLVIGRDDKERAAELTLEFIGERRPRDYAPVAEEAQKDLAPAQKDLAPAQEDLAPGDRTRAYVKIQDGCDNYCAYCVIPYARGRARSRPISGIVDEVRGLAERGYKEIVLTGIHVASYGKDLSDGDLQTLLPLAAGVDGIERVRFSSVEPLLITEEFCETLSRLPNICDHFHLSLQSGCDATLTRMRRRYNTSQYREAVERLREAYPDAGITTDIIVGFPGETDEEFEQSRSFAQSMDFLKIHVFPFSPKKGTAAALMPQRVIDGVKKARADRLLRLSESLGLAFKTKYIGKHLKVLFEDEVTPGVFAGYSTNYINVRACSPVCDPRGRIGIARPTDVFTNYVKADILRL